MSEKSNHGGRRYVLPLLDQFKHEGPNGQYVCFVFDVLGHHLDFQTAKYEDGRLPIKAYPAHNNGADHSRYTDLKPTNILLELDNPEKTIDEYLAEVPARVTNDSGVTKPLREVIRTPLVSEMREPHVRIVDFGVASWSDKHLAEMIQSPALRAPEVTIGADWDSKVDIWSLGCLIIEFVQGIVPFSGVASKKGSWTVDDDRLARTIEILGNFPPELLQRGSKTAEFFNADGGLRRIPDLKSTSLERLIDGAEKPFLRPKDMSGAEVPVFIDFLRGMLTIDPTSRKPASELLQHDWLKM
ncbi:hypothetical protein N7468_000414 [Penicillium chermesinum]|uniref:non-specific serine/threonine protein kinase n=1 Tax=Penicillium chermesinum TaxID=63820 RepID=A0A9W9PM02_9EURO|nr:uncharacterized protein N7468_000414 [Penicillium chermesinum]KAJ5248963.1 hypothetical protein N7468_000414 [Penicillium chermesinum]KAJ6151069.1 hypothetical protein N7470_007663 [Penicillium chermesinum]